MFYVLITFLLAKTCSHPCWAINRVHLVCACRVGGGWSHSARLHFSLGPVAKAPLVTEEPLWESSVGRLG